MNSNMIGFSDAVYHRKDKYDFGMTIFSPMDLKVLVLIDGKRTVSEIAGILSSDAYSLMPQFVKLVKLRIIHTEDGIISAGAADLVFSEPSRQPTGSLITATI